MSTPKKSKSQNNEHSHASSSGEVESSSNKSTMAGMTNREYLRLSRGAPDDEQIKSYIGMKDETPLNKIQDKHVRSIDEADAKVFRQALDRSTQIHHEIVWEKRWEMVIEMNHDTLQVLARHYGILPSAECIRDHPDASHLDKGPLLARLHQFFVWDVEYFDTAPEMRDIDVETVIEAAKTWKKGWYPSNTEMLESVLRHASACKKANDNMLYQALKECIAVTCACPALEKMLKLRINSAAEQIDDIGDAKDYEDSDKIEESLNTLKRRIKDNEKKLQEICSYIDGFAPGKAMPEIIKNYTDKWYVEQFTEGMPVGSVVRVAWLVYVFHSFWQKHQKAYLASDPNQRRKQEMAYADGIKGALVKIDKKWRSFTSQFAEYMNSESGRSKALSSFQAQNFINGFGDHLISQQVKGATSKRTVVHIKEFISTLVLLMDHNADDGKVEYTWKRLSTGAADQRKVTAYSDSLSSNSLALADKKLRGSKGKFLKSPFSTLPLETFKECLEMLRGAKQHSNVLPKTGRRPKKGL